MVKNNKLYIIFGSVIAVLLSTIIVGAGYYKNKLSNAEQNIDTYKGHIEQLQLKNGELISANNSYILKTKDLENQFNLSKKEVKDLEKKLGDKLAYISKISTKIQYDTITAIKDTIIYRDNLTEVQFKYTDKWTSFNGVTKLANNNAETSIYDLNINVPLKVGLADNYKIFVQSDNPYIQFTDIEGAVIDGSKFNQKKKRVSWGVQLGIGAMYDIIDKNISVGPYGGLGVQLNF